ncbi:nucleotidyltransferase domain-containing protein [Halomonas sp. JS92-SW72]|uniref:type VII toxin-antitoxin system MntA family adenylyltransferase antitoxin n=1 Tax=Halomonas sp. JS92-SW72 TaxID=2306583 RepID=UPI000E5A1D22|nr:nucleotidyltransferase domain-containing protein [Halomonas sp. JS92-SW72]AXY42247.1 nucleotidyltransferase domain-containing protein [Halomonas sp. JS92-SW72]
MSSTVDHKDAPGDASIPQSETLTAIISLARRRDDLAAVWLYGSRARGDHHPGSDFDLAVAFTGWIADPLERRLRPELLAQEWQRELGLGEEQLSVVDLAIAPIPLGWSILSQGVLLVDLDWDTRIRQESRILSRWEIDYLHPEGIHA